MGNAVESKGALQDAELVAEDLWDSLPDLLPPHHDARRCVPGVRGGDAAHHPGWGATFCGRV